MLTRPLRKVCDRARFMLLLLWERRPAAKLWLGLKSRSGRDGPPTKAKAKLLLLWERRPAAKLLRRLKGSSGRDGPPT